MAKQMRYGLLSRHGERFAAPDLQGGSLESLSLGVEEVINTRQCVGRGGLVVIASQSCSS